MKPRHLAHLLALPLAALLLSGCWSRLETNELGIVIGYGVDWQAGTYVVTASVLNPRALGTPGNEAGNPTQPTHIMMTGRGSTPGEALAAINTVSSRRTLWGSAQVVVIGEALARHGIDPLLSAITHQPNFRPTTRLFIAHGTARSVFATNVPGLETTIGLELFLMAENAHRAQSYLFAPHVFDVVRWERQKQRAILVPGVSGTTPPLPQGTAYTLPDSAVLHDGRLVAWLPRTEVRPALWTEGLFVHGEFDVPCPGKPGQQGEVHITSGRRSIRVVTSGKRVTAIRVGLRGEGAVTQSCPGASPQAMGTATTAAIAAQERQSLRWAQGQQLDIFGFGETIYRHHPRIWLQTYAQDWPAALARLPVLVTARIRVSQPGITR